MSDPASRAAAGRGPTPKSPIGFHKAADRSGDKPAGENAPRNSSVGGAADSGDAASVQQPKFKQLLENAIIGADRKRLQARELAFGNQSNTTIDAEQLQPTNHPTSPSSSLPNKAFKAQSITTAASLSVAAAAVANGAGPVALLDLDAASRSREALKRNDQPLALKTDESEDKDSSVHGSLAGEPVAASGPNLASAAAARLAPSRGMPSLADQQRMLFGQSAAVPANSAPRLRVPLSRLHSRAPPPALPPRVSTGSSEGWARGPPAADSGGRVSEPDRRSEVGSASANDAASDITRVVNSDVDSSEGLALEDMWSLTDRDTSHNKQQPEPSLADSAGSSSLGNSPVAVKPLPGLANRLMPISSSMLPISSKYAVPTSSLLKPPPAPDRQPTRASPTVPSAHSASAHPQLPRARSPSPQMGHPRRPVNRGQLTDDDQESCDSSILNDDAGVRRNLSGRDAALLSGAAAHLRRHSLIQDSDSEDEDANQKGKPESALSPGASRSRPAHDRNALGQGPAPAAEPAADASRRLSKASNQSSHDRGDTASATSYPMSVALARVTSQERQKEAEAGPPPAGSAPSVAAVSQASDAPAHPASSSTPRRDSGSSEPIVAADDAVSQSSKKKLGYSTMKFSKRAVTDLWAAAVSDQKTDGDAAASVSGCDSESRTETETESVTVPRVLPTQQLPNVAQHPPQLVPLTPTRPIELKVTTPAEAPKSAAPSASASRPSTAASTAGPARRTDIASEDVPLSEVIQQFHLNLRKCLYKKALLTQQHQVYQHRIEKERDAARNNFARAKAFKKVIALCEKKQDAVQQEMKAVSATERELVTVLKYLEVHRRIMAAVRKTSLPKSAEEAGDPAVVNSQDPSSVLHYFATDMSHVNLRMTAPTSELADWSGTNRTQRMAAEMVLAESPATPVRGSGIVSVEPFPETFLSLTGAVSVEFVMDRARNNIVRPTLVRSLDALQSHDKSSQPGVVAVKKPPASDHNEDDDNKSQSSVSLIKFPIEAEKFTAMGPPPTGPEANHMNDYTLPTEFLSVLGHTEHLPDDVMTDVLESPEPSPNPSPIAAPAGSASSRATSGSSATDSSISPMPPSHHLQLPTPPMKAPSADVASKSAAPIAPTSASGRGSAGLEPLPAQRHLSTSSSAVSSDPGPSPAATGMDSQSHRSSDAGYQEYMQTRRPVVMENVHKAVSVFHKVIGSRAPGDTWPLSAPEMERRQSVGAPSVFSSHPAGQPLHPSPRHLAPPAGANAVSASDYSWERHSIVSAATSEASFSEAVLTSGTRPQPPRDPSARPQLDEATRRMLKERKKKVKQKQLQTVTMEDRKIEAKMIEDFRVRENIPEKEYHEIIKPQLVKAFASSSLPHSISTPAMPSSAADKPPPAVVSPKNAAPPAQSATSPRQPPPLPPLPGARPTSQSVPQSLSSPELAKGSTLRAKLPPPPPPRPRPASDDNKSDTGTEVTLPASSDGAGQWRCPQCTFTNAEDKDRCAGCQCARNPASIGLQIFQDSRSQLLCDRARMLAMTAQTDDAAERPSAEQNQKLQSHLGLMKRGVKVIKFHYNTRSSNAHGIRWLWLSTDQKAVMWSKKREDKDPSFVWISEIKDVKQGVQTDVLKQRSDKSVDNSLCMSLVLDSRTVDFAFFEREDINAWVKMLQQQEQWAS